MRAPVVAVILLWLAATAFAKRPAPPGDAATRLVGVWTIAPNDEAGLAAYGPCTMEFKPNGELVYSVPDGKMLLTYHVEGDVIVSNQLSHPRPDRTRFSFAPDGSLVLDHDGQHARFLKQPPPRR